MNPFSILTAIPVPHVLLEHQCDDIWEPQGLVGFSGSVNINAECCSSFIIFNQYQSIVPELMVPLRIGAAEYSFH